MLLQRSFINKYIFVLLLVVFCSAALAQTPKETAASKGKEALKLEDQGYNDEALKLFTEAQTLDPANTVYTYEIAYLWYAKKQYQQVIDKLETIKDKPGNFDKLYQLLGKSYAVLDQNAKAVVVYDEGLKKFPNSGILNMERGLVPMDENKYPEALKYFEKGIEADPSFPSNYYWAAKLYCNSTEPIWGLLYGELFMNLERSGQRNNEIGKLLFDTYKNQITFIGGGKFSMSLSKQEITEGRKPDRLPYTLVYQPTLGAALAGETSIDINSLDRIRQNFLKFYNDRGFNKTYPNALFAYQDKITQAGCMEAYNHWLLFKGDEPIFKVWRAQNPAKWQDFIKWFGANPLKLNDTNKFYRMQY